MNTTEQLNAPATPDKWHWAITPQQIDEIKQGNRETINAVYFDNLPKFRKMASNYCWKWQFNKNLADDITQQIYIDLPTYDFTNTFTLAKGIKKSMRNAIWCGQEFSPLSIDMKLGAGRNRHQDDEGRTLAEILKAPEEEMTEEERQEMERRVDEMCDRAKGVQRIALYCIAYGNTFADGVKLYGKN